METEMITFAFGVLIAFGVFFVILYADSFLEKKKNMEQEVEKKDISPGMLGVLAQIEKDMYSPDQPKEPKKQTKPVYKITKNVSSKVKSPKKRQVKKKVVKKKKK